MTVRLYTDTSLDRLDTGPLDDETIAEGIAKTCRSKLGLRVLPSAIYLSIHLHIRLSIHLSMYAARERRAGEVWPPYCALNSAE